jgi:hypothetical protein
MDICAQGTADQVRPLRPRPAVWLSAVSTVPAMSSPADARLIRSALVEPVSETTSMRRHVGPGIEQAARRALASSAIRSML